MPLLPILSSNPEQVYALDVRQVVAVCGDGKLADGTECSRELRAFLQQARSEKLFSYAEACINGIFDRSERGGYVLQDLINEMGRRLEFRVENGIYQGRQDTIGYDGIWYGPDGYAIVIEVKTTDVYRINLDDIAEYREKLIAAQRIEKRSSILVVVGRQDTGDLEAQVRGSRHAWDIRLLSIDALIKLMKLKEETEDNTTAKIRDLLVPFEYTRLDRIIDVAFTAATDAGSVVKDQIPLEPDQDEAAAGESDEQKSQDHTPQDILGRLRDRIVAAVAGKQGVALVRKSAALYWSTDDQRRTRLVCSISKRHKQGHYWYAYHPHWDSFLSEAERGFYVLGRVGRDDAYALPFDWIHSKLEHLYVTKREDKLYWHVYLEEDSAGQVAFRIFKLGQLLPVHEFRIEMAKPA